MIPKAVLNLPLHRFKESKYLHLLCGYVPVESHFKSASELGLLLM